MKLKTILLAGALTLSSGALATVVLLSSQAAKPAASPINAAHSSAAVSETVGYTVRCVDGTVEIIPDDGGPAVTAPGIQVDALPESERQRLSDGIHVGSRDDMLRLIENYES